VSMEMEMEMEQEWDWDRSGIGIRIGCGGFFCMGVYRSIEVHWYSENQSANFVLGGGMVRLGVVLGWSCFR